MRLQFWGAARTVTGSMHLLEANGRRILLDCGLVQGRRKEAFERNRNLPFHAGEIDAVVLSHAHIDHSGNLPSLSRNGFRGAIYSTPATRDLCAYLLLDSANIQESDVRYVNKRRAKEGKRPFEPLYERADALRVLERFRMVGYGDPFEPVPGIRVEFHDAGHILGSAIVVLDVEENGRGRRLLFSGDIGRKGLPILRDPQVAENVDLVIMEATYGNRFHESTGDMGRHLEETVSDTVERRGKLLIPSFAVGRTQEIVYRMNQMWEAGQMPPIDVFVDSPLAVNATEVFRLHPECNDEEFLDTLRTDSDHDPFGFDRLHYVRSSEQSRELNTREEPAVIIAASGMCEGGRILHHLKHHGGDPRTIILFVSYQAEHTLGRRILEGLNPVKIYGEKHEIRGEVRKAEGYSAHADRGGLLDWAREVCEKGSVDRFFLVHGEDEGLEGLAEGLTKQGATNVTIPERGQAFEL